MHHLKTILGHLRLLIKKHLNFPVGFHISLLVPRRPRWSRVLDEKLLQLVRFAVFLQVNSTERENTFFATTTSSVAILVLPQPALFSFSSSCLLAKLLTNALLQRAALDVGPQGFYKHTTIIYSHAFFAHVRVDIMVETKSLLFSKYIGAKRPASRPRSRETETKVSSWPPTNATTRLEAPLRPPRSPRSQSCTKGEAALLAFVLQVSALLLYFCTTTTTMAMERGRWLLAGEPHCENLTEGESERSQLGRRSHVVVSK